MFADFQAYAASVKPGIETALCDCLTTLPGVVGLPGSAETGPCLRGGKNIRGALLCLVVEVLGGSPEAALPRAVAVEQIQAASLIHDDFVDQHRTRRQRPALWILEGPRRAVLLGDVLFSSAIHMMSELGREDCRIVAQAIAELSRGAYHEPLDPAALLAKLDEGGVGAVGYEQVIALKTGILFAAACELGAVAAGAEPSMQQRWRRYGQQIGEAYQLADDLQEMVQALDKAVLSAADLIDLVPPLLFFVPQSGPAVRRALRRQSAERPGELGPHIQAAVGLMQKARQRRLRAAVAELDGMLQGGPLLQLARRTPRDLIGMFDATAFPAADCAG